MLQYVPYVSHLLQFDVWHQSYILSLWTEEKRGSAGRGVYHERSIELDNRLDFIEELVDILVINIK